MPSRINAVLSGDGLPSRINAVLFGRHSAGHHQRAVAVRRPPVLAGNGVTEVVVEFWPRDVPSILVPPTTLDAAGLRPARDGVRLLIRLDRPVTEGDLVVAMAIAGRYDQRIQGAVPPPSIDAGQVRTLATAATAAIALLVALAGLALLTAEARSADPTLLELGAPPRLHRQLAAIRALLPCGLAGALALVIGTFALSVVTRTGSLSSLTERVAFPTPATVAVTLLIPLAAAILTGLTGQIPEETRKTDRSV